VRAGEQELLTPGAEPALRHGEWRAEYDHGAVIERYDVRGDGLAQSFVIARRPAPGDLVVVGEVTTPLHAAGRAAAHAPVAFALADGRGVIEFGAATAIDANGVATAMTTAVDGGRIVLRLAAAAVARAAFPLVLDPLIANTLLTQGAPLDECDLVHETRTAPGLFARTWVAESRTVAANDNDVRLYRFGTGFGGAGLEVFREITPWDSTHPRLAFVPSTDRVVLVFSTDIASERVLWVHRHHVNDLTLTTGGDFVPKAATDSYWRPDVGGRRVSTGDRVVIVFQREAAAPFADTATSEVWATVLDTSLAVAPFVVAPFRVRPLANRDQERPVVNQASSGTNWLLAFQEHNGNAVNDDWDVETLAIDSTGALGAGGVATEEHADSSRHKVGPQIAGSAGRYLLTYATRTFEQTNPKPTSPEGQVVRAQRIDYDHAAGSGARPWPAVDLLAPGMVTVRTAGLAFDPQSTSHWCAGVRRDDTTSYRVCKLGYTGNVVESGTLPLAAGATPRSLAIAFNQEQRGFLVAFTENDGSAATNVLQGTQMQYDALPPVTTTGFACGTGAWSGIGAIDDRRQIGAQALPLALAGAPLDSAAILFVSTGALPIDGGLLGAPGCTLYPDLLPPNYLGSPAFTITGGGAATSLDLPEHLPPMTLTLQWVYLVPAANPLGLQASEGLTVPIGR
jgi:hypothetical protein